MHLSIFICTGTTIVRGRLSAQQLKLSTPHISEYLCWSPTRALCLSKQCKWPMKTPVWDLPPIQETWIEFQASSFDPTMAEPLGE